MDLKTEKTKTEWWLGKIEQKIHHRRFLYIKNPIVLVKQLGIIFKINSCLFSINAFVVITQKKGKAFWCSNYKYVALLKLPMINKIYFQQFYNSVDKVSEKEKWDYILKKKNGACTHWLAEKKSDYSIHRWFDFNGMSTHQGLFYDLRLRNRDHCMFIFRFLCSFLRVVFSTVLSKTNNF